MKKFLIVVSVCLITLLAIDVAVFYFGIYIDLNPKAPVQVVSTSDDSGLYVAQDGKMIPFEVRGVTVGTGIPGCYGTDYGAEFEDYLRWFGQISALGANAVRAVRLYDNNFYDALYQFNTENPLTPLWLIQGVTVNDYLLGSSEDVMSNAVRERFLENTRAVVDAVHGRRKSYLDHSIGTGNYLKDVSPWVLAFMIGADWDGMTITYTNDKRAGNTPYTGEYVCATGEASAFESFLANMGDVLVQYESQKYKQQRLLTIASSPMTDPFQYNSSVVNYYKKIAQLDINHLVLGPKNQSGLFAAYNAVPYQNNPFDMEKEMLFSETDDIFGDMDLTALDPWELEELQAELESQRTQLLDIATVSRNTNAGQSDYRQYLQMLVEHHVYPVVVTEFGYSSARGTVYLSWNPDMEMTSINEQQQAKLMVEGLQDIQAAGCAGACLIAWQDEWERKAWNTQEKVNLERNIYWSDVQTASQCNGILSMDPGARDMACHVDGSDADWEGVPMVARNGETELYAQVDERYVYLMVRSGRIQDGMLYIPIDVTPKSGSSEPSNLRAEFEREADFVAVIDLSGTSRLRVQRRYEVLRGVNSFEVYNRNGFANAPSPRHGNFDRIYMQLKNVHYIGLEQQAAVTVETGRLRQGNSNPDSPQYDSLADFYVGEGFVEIRLPWQLLNFSDPSQKAVHDDYYEYHGLEPMFIKEIYMGAGYGGDDAIGMGAFRWSEWGGRPTYHERLKPAYYAIMQYWTTAV